VPEDRAQQMPTIPTMRRRASFPSFRSAYDEEIHIGKADTRGNAVVGIEQIL
jgi:hypothetical protein